MGSGSTKRKRTTELEACSVEVEDTFDFDKALLSTVQKHMFLLNFSEGVDAFANHGVIFWNNVIAFWRQHFVYREEMQEIYVPDNSTWSIDPETANGASSNLEYLYQHNEITKLPFAAAQVTQKALRCEKSRRHCLLNVDESTFGEIEHFMDSQDSSHPKYSEVSGLEFLMFSRDEQTAPRRHALSQGIANNQTLAFFIGRVYLFLTRLGMDENRLRFRQLPHNEMACDAADCWVAEIKCSYGWVSCVRITHKSACVHEKDVITPNKEELMRAFKDDHKTVRKALKALDYKTAMEIKYTLEQKGKVKFDAGTLQETVSLTKNMVSVSTKTITSSLIKLSFRIGRIISCLYEHCFHLGRDNGNQQLCAFRFPPLVAPIKCAISVKHTNYRPLAVSISQKLKAAGVVNELDVSGESMGHVRTDELGVPLAVVVDSITSVTIRERDSNGEIQLALEEVVAVVKDLTNGRDTWGALMDRQIL